MNGTGLMDKALPRPADRPQRDAAGDIIGASRLTLRVKWAIAFAAAVLYLVAVGLVVTQHREQLLATVQELEAHHPLEETLAKVNTSVAHAILKLQEVYYSADPRPGYEGIALDIEAIQAGLQGLKQSHPKIGDSLIRLDRDLAELRARPVHGALLELRDSLHGLVAQLDEATRHARDRRAILSEHYRGHHDATTLIAVFGGLVGILVFGGVITLFLTRLVWDVKKLEARALEVMTGYRGTPLEVTRHDEIGSLMEAVNHMQYALRAHERQLEVSRQQRFHQDKMAAIGSIAAAIAHEVNNPIAAISGVAEAIHDTQNSLACPMGGCRPELILQQTRRISRITRQLAEMTTPYSPEPQLLDLNALVRGTCGFVRYDKRFRNVEFNVDLDPHVPAINAIADHLMQVLMNLLINAADATAEITGRTPSIVVSTQASGDEVVLVVADNGCGMDAHTLARAFDEAFTTKPPGKGSGLGLFMCRSLIQAEGGRIALESVPGQCTRATIHLPRPADRG